MKENKNKKKSSLRLFIRDIREKIRRKNRAFEYAECIVENNYNKSKDFVDIAVDDYTLKTFDPKLIAFYLPQFYTFKENDEWHGRGFTEWTNVTQAIPQFTGHYQPKLPIDLGFYDLSNIETMVRQAELAKKYGIQGWCFHYYWFSGKKLMEKPIYNLLEHPEINMPFCFNWANESWSKMWDGSNKELLMEQNLKDDDAEKFMQDAMPFFKDKRYIKIDDKPVLIIYRPKIFGKEKNLKLLSDFRRIAKENGFDNLYLICVNHMTFRDENPTEWGFDALVEFAPCELTDIIPNLKGSQLGYRTKYFKSNVKDMTNYITQKQYICDYPCTAFKTVFPSWDNSPRKAYSTANIFVNVTPERYKQWLKGCIDWTKENNSKDEQLVFINAWNEWAEGAYLEPDRKYGYAYLQATRDVLKSLHK